MQVLPRVARMYCLQLVTMVAISHSLPSGNVGGATEGGGGDTVDPSIHLLLPDNLLDSFGCLFGCSGGLNGGAGGSGNTETATISAPIEVSGFDIVKPENLDIPGFDINNLGGHNCNQAGCSGQGLAAIPHPESGPVVVLLGEDMENNQSEIIVLGDEAEQHTLQQSGLMASILNQLFQSDPTSVLSFDVPKLDIDEEAQHIPTTTTTSSENAQAAETENPQTENARESAVPEEQPQTADNLLENDAEQPEDRQPRISSASASFDEKPFQENVYVEEESTATIATTTKTTTLRTTTTELPTTDAVTVPAFGVADSDIIDDAQESFEEEISSSEIRKGRKHEGSHFDSNLLNTSPPEESFDVVHDTRLIEKDFPIEQNLVEKPRSSGVSKFPVNRINKLDFEDIFIEVPKTKARFNQRPKVRPPPRGNNQGGQSRRSKAKQNRFNNAKRKNQQKKKQQNNQQSAENDRNEKSLSAEVEDITEHSKFKVPDFPSGRFQPGIQQKFWNNVGFKSKRLELPRSGRRHEERDQFRSNARNADRSREDRNQSRGQSRQDRKNGNRSQNRGQSRTSQNRNQQNLDRDRENSQEVRGREERRNEVRGREERRNEVKGREDRRNEVRGREDRRNEVRGREDRRSEVRGREERINGVRGRNEVREEPRSGRRQEDRNLVGGSQRLRKFERRGRKFELFQSGCSAHMACVTYDECGKDGYVKDGLPHFHVGGRGMLQRCRMRGDGKGEAEGFCCRIWA